MEDTLTVRPPSSNGLTRSRAVEALRCMRSVARQAAADPDGLVGRGPPIWPKDACAASRRTCPRRSGRRRAPSARRPPGGRRARAAQAGLCRRLRRGRGKLLDRGVVRPHGGCRALRVSQCRSPNDGSGGPPRPPVLAYTCGVSVGDCCRGVSGSRHDRSRTGRAQRCSGARSHSSRPVSATIVLIV